MIMHRGGLEGETASGKRTPRVGAGFIFLSWSNRSIFKASDLDVVASR